MKSLTIRCALAGALLLTAAAAQARDAVLVLPLEAGLESVGPLLGPDLPLKFGKATAQGMETINFVESRGIGERWALPNANAGGTRARRTDGEACLDAFRRAIVTLQKQARAFGAGSIVGIVGFNARVETDTPTSYECALGYSRVAVSLKGQAARPAPQAPAK